MPTVKYRCPKCWRVGFYDDEITPVCTSCTVSTPFGIYYIALEPLEANDDKIQIDNDR